MVHPSDYSGNISDHHNNIIMMEKCEIPWISSKCDRRLANAVGSATLQAPVKAKLATDLQLVIKGKVLKHSTVEYGAFATFDRKPYKEED